MVPLVWLICNRPDGTEFVRGRRLTAFTDAEEKAAKLDTYMPFLLETGLR